MSQSAQFSNGMEFASFVTSSGLLQKSLDVITPRFESIISNAGEGISWKVYKEPFTNLIIIAFEVKSDSDHLQADLVASSDLREMNFPHFDFLCSKTTPNFSVNKIAFSLFFKNHERLQEWEKSEMNSTTPLIVTGHGLGGSIASLFTISLLDSIGSGKNRPLCITYGSPLIGDKKLQQSISRNPNWNSCFLHVVSYKDSLPRLFITNHTSSIASPSHQTSAYTPFGTFFLCSDDADSTCFQSPDSIMELLLALGSTQAQNQALQPPDYTNIVENLIQKLIYKIKVEKVTHSDSIIDIVLQLQALELTPHMQVEKFIWQKRVQFDPSKKLNQMKVNMAQLEWYKKEMKGKQIGYYDSYKNLNSPEDNDVIGFSKELTIYWEKMVEEAEMKPQKEGASFRTRWLYAGNNYRRMVEPLDIAKNYRKDGGSKSGLDYVNHGRSRHYRVLEEWLEEDKNDKKEEKNGTEKGEEGSNGKHNKNVELILTIDSCFWAHVEEALISCKLLVDAKSSVTEKKHANKKLLEFEDYVYGMLKKYEVSPEIFLKFSSYITWWNQYKAIKGTTGNQALANFMRDPKHFDQYTKGAYDFP